jgi:hypothetical protein
MLAKGDSGEGVAGAIGAPVLAQRLWNTAFGLWNLRGRVRNEGFQHEEVLLMCIYVEHMLFPMNECFLQSILVALGTGGRALEPITVSGPPRQSRAGSLSIH